MKLKLEKLRGAFSVVDRVQPLQVLESSQFVKLARSEGALSLLLTGSLRAEARVAFPGDGKWSFFLDRRALKAFLSTATAEEVSVSLEEGTLTLAAGQKLEAAKRAPVSGYETWAPKGTFELSPELSAALSVLVKYLPSVAGMEHVGAVRFDKSGVVATDTVGLAHYSLRAPAEFFLPPEVAQVVASAGGKIAADDKGAGAKIAGGHVYQPFDAALSQFPSKECGSAIAEGYKAPAKFRASAQALHDALKVASEFLLDKAELAKVSPAKGGALVTVDTGSGKFEKPVAAKTLGTFDPVEWPIKRILPWLESAARREGLEVEFAKTSSASALRFAGKDKSVLLVADV